MHHRGPLAAAGTALFTIGLAASIAAVASPADSVPGLHRPQTLPVHVQEVGSLEGLNATAVAGARWGVAVELERARQTVLTAAVQTQAAAAVAARRRSASVLGAAPSTGGAATVTGSCAAMKPAGFPDWIIQRESGGDPTARNSSSDAYGCAQILPGEGGSGDYAQRWANLYAGGRGICNWQPPRYCAG